MFGRRDPAKAEARAVAKAEAKAAKAAGAEQRAEALMKRKAELDASVRAQKEDMKNTYWRVRLHEATSQIELLPTKSDSGDGDIRPLAGVRMSVTDPGIRQPSLGMGLSSIYITLEGPTFQWAFEVPTLTSSSAKARAFAARVNTVSMSLKE